MCSETAALWGGELSLLVVGRRLRKKMIGVDWGGAQLNTVTCFKLSFPGFDILKFSRKCGEAFVPRLSCALGILCLGQSSQGQTELEKQTDDQLRQAGMSVWGDMNG